MKKVIFLKNAAILTVSSLILRFLGILFKVWLAAEVGSEGIGLYQIIFSVYMLAATFAASGICTAVTRLIADELALGCKNGVLKILKRSILITLIIAFASTAVIYFGADPISRYILGDLRAIPALKILSFSLPFMGVCSCLRGYFIARRKAGPPAFSQILEQLVRIVTVLFLVKKYAKYGLAVTCGAVLFGDTVAEASSCILLGLIYACDKSHLSCLQGRKNPPFRINKAISHIALPITAGKYLNTALRTFENILVPKGLQSFGSGNALSQFGMIKGMALPILFFPSTLLNSLSTLLIPEISEASARKLNNLVKEATERILQITSLISFIFASIFLICGKQIGSLIYKSDDVGFLLCVLSPIVPLMYLDSVADGILKGLDKQAFCFRTAIFDSSLRIGMILAALPLFGIKGFIGIMYISNFLTCSLNITRLIRVSGAEIKLTTGLFLPLSSALCVTIVVNSILRLLALPNLVYVILLCAVCLPIYTILLFVFNCVNKDDIIDFLPRK